MSIPASASPAPERSTPSASTGGGSSDKKDAAAHIKGRTPKNASGALKKALDATKKLKSSRGNPKMEDAVGADNIASMMAEVAAAFSQPSPNDQDFCGHALEQLLPLQAHLASMQSIMNPTADEKSAIADMKTAIALLLKSMQQHNCPLPPTANTAQPNG